MPSNAGFGETVPPRQPGASIFKPLLPGVSHQGRFEACHAGNERTCGRGRPYCTAWRSNCWYAVDEYPSEADAKAFRAAGDNLGRGLEDTTVEPTAWATCDPTPWSTRAVMGGSGSGRGSGLASASRISRELSTLRSKSVRSRCADWDKPAAPFTMEVNPIAMPASATIITAKQTRRLG
jgi:hypothetical protein